MVKLLRLTTENNCNFQADLDAGIEVSKKAQIAVQWDTGAVTGNPSLTIEGYIPAKEYTRVDIEGLAQSVVHTLNQTQAVDVAGTLNLNLNYAEFGLATTNDERSKIQYKLSPLTMPLHTNEDGTRRSAANGNELFGMTKAIQTGTGTLLDSLGVNDLTTDAGILLGNLFQNLATSSDTAELKNFIFPTHPCGDLSNGCGVFTCIVNNVTDNGGASDTNGFGIGLSFTDLQSTVLYDGASDTILPAERDFEIRIKKPADNYTFHTPANPGVEQTSTTAPHKYDLIAHAVLAEHDLMMIEKKEDEVIGSILNTATGNAGQRIELFRYLLTAEQKTKKLHPYIYMCGGATTAVCGHPVFTPHVLENDNLQYQVTGREQNLVIPSSGDPSRNFFELMVLTNGTYTGALANLLNNDQFDDDIYSTTQRMRIVMNSKVANILGFNTTPGQNEFVFDNDSVPNTTRIRVANANSVGYDLEAANNLQATNSDNYSVIIDSNPVMGFDASKFNYEKGGGGVALPKSTHKRGRRLNILATLPVNDTTGIVEYNANELVYIDLDNTFPQVLKNMRLRVLDKDFSEIKTIGESVITLLIKDDE